MTTLQDRWPADVDEEAERKALDDLLEAAKDATTEHPEARQRLDAVDARLDLLERRGVDFPGYRRRLERMTQGVSAAWSSGLLYYQGGQYAEAARTWEPAVRARGEVKLWRWLLLAQCGAQMPAKFEPAREALEKVVQALEARDAMTAAQIWDTLKDAAPWVTRADVPVRHLGTELVVVQRVQNGRAEELIGDKKQSPEAWDKAATAYQHAVEHLITIPYVDLLREAYTWQGLEARGKTLRLKSETYRAASARAQELQDLLKADFKAGLAQVQTVLATTPGASEVLLLCQTYARELRDSAPAQALELVDVALLYGHTTGAEWTELRRDLQDAVRRRDAADIDLRRLEVALDEHDWSTVQQVAQALSPEARIYPRYAEIIRGIEASYHKYLDKGNLPIVQQLDAILTTLGGSAEERTQSVQNLQQAQRQAKLEQKAKEIEKVAQEGNWTELRRLAADLPAAMRTELRYDEMIQHITEIYRRKLQQHSLWASWQLHEALTLLGDESETRAQELTGLERTLQVQNENMEERARGLNSELSTLHKQVDEEKDKRSEAERKCKEAEACIERLKDFREWTEKLSARWQSLEAELGTAAFPRILREMEQVIRQLSEPYTDLTGTKAYQDWRTFLVEEKIPRLKQRIAVAQSRERLDNAQRQLDEAVHQEKMLTPESLKDAQSAYTRAIEELNYQPPDQHRARHERLQDQAQTTEELLQVMSRGPTMQALQQARAFETEITAIALQGNPESGDSLREKIREWGNTWRKVRESFGERWPQATEIFPWVKELDRGLIQWVNLYPLSGNGQGHESVLRDSLPLSSKLQDALSKIESTIKGMDANVKQVEQRVHSRSRWLPWGLFLAALALSAVPLALFFFGARPMQQETQDQIAALVKAVVTVTPTIAPSPTAIPTITPSPTATLSPAPSATVTPTTSPASTPSATLPFTGVVLNVIFDVTLCDMPSLTITTAPSWTLAVSNTVLAATDPQSVAWTVNVSVTNQEEKLVPVSGTWALSGTMAARWQPVTPTIRYAGEYLVRLTGTSPTGEIREGTSARFTIAEKYDVEFQRKEPQNPSPDGQIIDHFTITNTGNTDDVICLAFLGVSNAPSETLNLVIAPIAVAPITQVLPLTSIECPKRITSTDEEYSTIPTYTVALPPLPPREGLSIFVHFLGFGDTYPQGGGVLIPHYGEGEPVFFDYIKPEGTTQ